MHMNLASNLKIVPRFLDSQSWDGLAGAPLEIGATHPEKGSFADLILVRFLVGKMNLQFQPEVSKQNHPTQQSGVVSTMDFI